MWLGVNPGGRFLICGDDDIVLERTCCCCCCCCILPSFATRSANALLDSMKGSKPKSSSACAAAAAESVCVCGGRLGGRPAAGPAAPKPNAACQSVVDVTGILSGISSATIHIVLSSLCDQNISSNEINMTVFFLSTSKPDFQTRSM